MQWASTDGHVDLPRATVQILIPDVNFGVSAMLNLGAGDSNFGTASHFFFVSIAGQHASCNDLACIPREYKEGEETTLLLCACELHRQPNFVFCHRVSSFEIVIS